MIKEYDYIVVGLGIVGSATLYNLSQSGYKVLGIEQFTPAHAKGSSHGGSRVIRKAIGEGEEYVDLALHSYDLWRELEKTANTDLLHITGGLYMASAGKNGVPELALNGSDDFLTDTMNRAKRYHIKHSILTANDIRKKFPQFNLKGDEIGYYEYDSGFLLPEKCIVSYLNQSQKNNADVLTNCKISSITVKPGKGVELKSDSSTFFASRVVLSAGPWIGELLGSKYSSIFTVYKQIVYWYDLQQSYSNYTEDKFPIFLWFNNGTDSFFGFPAMDGKKGGIKIVPTNEYYKVDAPTSSNPKITSSFIKKIYDYNFNGFLHGIGDKCLKYDTCLFTCTKDKKFIIDVHPEHPEIIIASPCSSHGFKHAPAVAELIARLTLNTVDKTKLKPFSIQKYLQ